MPRRKKEKLTFEEQLANINQEIATCSEKLKMLKAEKKELEDRADEAKKEELYQAVLKSGKSMDDVIGLLSAQ